MKYLWVWVVVTCIYGAAHTRDRVNRRVFVAIAAAVVGARIFT